MLIKNLFWGIIKIFFKLYFAISKKSPSDPILQKTLKLYSDDAFMKDFSAIRTWDAPFEDIENSVPKKGLIVDLGCGDGLLANYLALKGKSRKVIGVELNKDRVGKAGKNIKNTKFVQGDILNYKFPAADCVLLVHVLHHLESAGQQEKLLKQIQKKIKRGGKLLIVEIDQKPILKYIFTWLTDAITVPILFESKLFSTNFHYRSENKWRQLLEKFGFATVVTRPHTGKPFSHIMFLCQKK